MRLIPAGQIRDRVAFMRLLDAVVEAVLPPYPCRCAGPSAEGCEQFLESPIVRALMCVSRPPKAANSALEICSYRKVCFGALDDDLPSAVRQKEPLDYALHISLGRAT